jgi:prepilin-type N-terminal cleavage/methylation domain-containing protein
MDTDTNKYMTFTQLSTLKKNAKGFTLIELLVVIGILAVLLAITLIAINPAKQFAQANNTKRRSDVNAILNAINQYMADNKGSIPTGVTSTTQTISNGGANLCSTLVPQYIAALPVDPLTNNGASITDCSGAYTTNYQVVQSTTNSRITVTAPAAELSETITVTR